MKTRRHAKILELIGEQEIDTQDELLRWLHAEGYNVTQATISRDIRELRLIKSLSSSGKYRYSTGKSDTSDNSAKFYHLFSDSVLSVDYAVNLVVIRCMTGMAQAVCAALDSLYREGIVGTIAGDDTIFVATRSENNAITLASEFKKLVQDHGKQVST